ncbi:MAG TPA: S1/P1 nuclease [Novosphingobium sp.]|nr:S1/P1 nuclease [Novosphingobium sp.]
MTMPGTMLGKLRWACMAAAAAAMAMAGPAMAWGNAGHRMVAEIAEANVPPQVQAEIAQLLAAEAGLGTPACRVHSLADAATWPDCLRGEDWRWAYTFAWHYQDADVLGHGFDAAAHCTYGNCVTAQIARNRRILADRHLPAAQRLEALAFLAHFVGDIHQPLHAADHDDDHGGNGVKASWPGDVPSSLHWFWDKAVAERAIATAPGPMVRLYSAEERARIATGQPADWAQESWQIAHDVVYPQAFGHLPARGEAPPAMVVMSQQQLDADAPIGRQRLVQAGLRLARELTAALGG